MVPSYKRTQSYLEYEQVAFNLLNESIQKISKMPNRTFRLIGKYLLDDAHELYYLVLKIKDLYYFKDEESTKNRKQLIIQAASVCDHLAALLTIAYTHNNGQFTDSQWQHWFDYINNEVALLDGLRKKSGTIT